nr:DNA topoisomerase [Streptococcus gallolyticus]
MDHSYQQALAGQARAKADWLIGMNGTRFISLILNELGFSTPLPKTVGGVSVGRVMTPTLFLVYNREREIETFKPRTYYTLSAVFQHPNGQYEGKLIVPDITLKNGKKWNGELDKEEQWRTFLARYAPSFFEGVVAGKTSETKYTRSPRLFTLNDLQQVMNKKIGISLIKPYPLFSHYTIQKEIKRELPIVKKFLTTLI